MSTTKIVPVTTFIEDVIREVPGWTPADELLCLYNLVLASAHLGGDVLEIGSWCGRSTVVMAAALQVCGCGRLQAIDLFPSREDWQQNPDGTWSFKTGDIEAYAHQTIYDEPYQKCIAPLYNNYTSIMDIFINSLKKFNVEDVVDYHKGNWKTWQNIKNTKFRLAFIDADHGYDAAKADTQFALSRIDEGWLCFDDAFSCYKGIDKLIEEFIWPNSRVGFTQQLCRKFHVAYILKKGGPSA